MSFTPLNPREQSVHDIEKHTREVELENALRLYQNALKQHYDGQAEQAQIAYESLLASDILQDVLKKGSNEILHSSSSNVQVTSKSSSISLLPFLLFKNHGTLVLEHLRHHISAADEDLRIETLKQVVLEYATALSFDSNDPSLWRRIAELSDDLGLDRTRRFALECQLSAAGRRGTNDSLSLFWNDSFQDDDQLIKSSLSHVLKTLRDTLALKYLELPVDSPFSLQPPRRRPISVPLNDLQRDVHTVNVRPSSCNWYALARSIIEKLRVASKSHRDAPLHLLFELPFSGFPAASDSSDHIEDEFQAESPRSRISEDQLNSTRSRMSSVVSSSSKETSLLRDKQEAGATEHWPAADETSSLQQGNAGSPHSPILPTESNLLVDSLAEDKCEGFGVKRLAEDSGIQDTNGEFPVVDDFDMTEEIATALETRKSFDEPQEYHEIHESPGSAAPEQEIVGPDHHRQKRNRESSHDETDDQASTRASKRVKQRSATSSGAYVDPIRKTLEELFVPLGIDLEPFLRISAASLDREDSDLESNSLLDDLKLLLTTDWHDDKVDNANSTQGQIASTSAISKIMALDYPTLVSPKKDADCSVDAMQEFIARIDNGLSYYHCVNLELVLTLLDDGRHKHLSPYLESSWSTSFRTLVIEFIIAEEPALLQTMNEALAVYHTLDALRSFISWTQAVSELFMDELVAEEKSRLIASLERPVNLEIRYRAQRWLDLVNKLLKQLPSTYQFEQCQDLRHRWSLAIVGQATGAAIEDTLKLYTALSNEMSERPDHVALRLPNCQSTQMIDRATLDLELSKLSTLDFFDAVFESSRKSDHSVVLQYLAPVLLLTNTGVTPEQKVIEQYLSRSPLEFRLKLWEMLAKATSAQGDTFDALYCNLQCIRTAMSVLASDTVRSMSTALRQVELIRFFNKVSAFLRDGLRTFSASSTEQWTWTSTQCVTSLQICFDFLSLLQIFVFYEDSIAEDDSHARKSYSYLNFRDHRRQDLLRCWIVVYRVYKHYLILDNGQADMMGHALATLISFLHEELGPREYCQLLSGALLDLFESEIFALDRAETECDLVQVLHCKYELSYQVGSFIPWEHYAKPVELTREKALQILPFVLTFVVEKSPGIWLPKADVKNALERLHLVLWPIVNEMPSLTRTQSIVERYLAKDIVSQDLSNTLRGILAIECPDVVRPSSLEEKPWAALETVSLTLGRCHLSLFQSRSKNTSKGPTDLDLAKKYYLHDLALNPRRPETWWALGFINAALVDIDLGYDAQRLWDHRDKTADKQREALLCYMMCISLSMSLNNRHKSDACIPARSFADILFEFGSQLYNAARQPMTMKCFERSQVKYLETGQGRAELSIRPSITTQMVLKTAAKCLHTAGRNCTDKWRCHLLLGKCHEKLKLEPEVALKDYHAAIKHAPTQNTGEQGPLIDPHYRMTSSVYKFTSSDAISPETAIKYLHFTSFTPTEPEQLEEPSKASVIALIKLTLNNICAADKKHWHHRPIHRLAVLVQHFPIVPTTENEVVDTPDVQAGTMLESLFTARGSGGNLLSIWKPEFERPGRHYYYTNKYTKYYIDLLFVQADLELIFAFMKRLRKAYQSVLHHRDIWQSLCERYIDLVKTKSQIGELDADELIDVVDMPLFNKVAQNISEAVELDESSEPPAHRVMRDFYELRRLNGGLYDANKIDDALINCYLILYRDMQTLMAVREEEAKLAEQAQPILIDSSASTPLPSMTFFDGTSTAIPIPNSPSKPEGAPSSVEVMATAPVTKGRGRTKEVKIVKVGRRDILLKCFALCKPRPVPVEARPLSERRKSQEDKVGEVVAAEVVVETNVVADGEDTNEHEVVNHLQQASVADQTKTSDSVEQGTEIENTIMQ